MALHNTICLDHVKVKSIYLINAMNTILVTFRIIKNMPCQNHSVSVTHCLIIRLNIDFYSDQYSGRSGDLLEQYFETIWSYTIHTAIRGWSTSGYALKSCLIVDCCCCYFHGYAYCCFWKYIEIIQMYS